MKTEMKEWPRRPLSHFRQSLLDPDEFTLTFELVPSRGGRGWKHDRILEMARMMADDGRIRAVSITDNAGGHPALSPEVFGLDILEMGIDVINHFSCKDKNRNQMESLLFGWDRAGLTSLLVISGDYPKRGYCGHPKPVFDLDSVQVVEMLNRMNQGNFEDREISATSFFKGVAISPFKYTEAEQMMQYFKLHRKVAAGADFAITQVGFDVRKFQELLLFMEQKSLNIPVLGNVFIPNLPVLEMMRRGKVPGCVIPESLYQQMQKEAKADDKGKKARLVRAAKLLSILKSLGFGGAHLGGTGLSFGDLDFVLNQSLEFDDCRQYLIEEMSCSSKDVFFYFSQEKATGLNRPEPAGMRSQKNFSFRYSLALAVHNLAFDPQGFFFSAARTTCLALDKTCLRHVLDSFELITKKILFQCRNCGDCTLADLAFICPQSGCPKFLLNGPCGGSRDGWCEVYPKERRCLYVRIYERLDQEQQEQFKKRFVSPRNWSLNEKSSWLHFYGGLDHCSRGCQVPESKEDGM